MRLVAEADGQALANHLVPRGKLRITTPISLGAKGLMPTLGDYTSRYPEVELDIALCDRTVDLIEEGFEAAVRIGSLPDSGLIARPLIPYRMMICASPDYITKYGEPRRPQDLSDHHCIAFRYSAGSDWRMTNDEGMTSVQVSGAIQVNNGQAVRVAALTGPGIIMQPEIMLAQDVTAGRLIRLLPDYKLPSRPMHIVYLRDQHMSPKLRSFIIERFGSKRSS